MTRQEFIQNYWRYYLMLEKKFIHTLSYVELAEENYNSYSNEYALLLQSIGAELDSFFKVYCGFNPDDRKNMNDYAEFILRAYPEIKEQRIDISVYGLSFIPFANWDTARPSQSLPWWQAFDDIKHKRSECKEQASQKNVLESLGALYLLEIKYLHKITLAANEIDIPDEESSIFSLRNWNYRFSAAKDYVFSNTSDGSPIIDGGGA